MKSPAKRLTRTYICALFAVAMTAIIGQFVIQSTFSNAEMDGHVINFAGRQRMLSERIVKSALMSQNKEIPYAKRLVARESLTQSIELLSDTHRAFRYGDAKLELNPIDQPVVVNLFDELEPLFEKLVTNANEIVAAEIEKDVIDQILSLSNQQQRYVTLMDEIVVRMSRESAKKVSQSSNIEYLLLGITMFLLLFEGFFVFHPAVEQVRKSFEKITAREQELLESERRHRDLFEYSGGPLLSLHPETGRIINANPAAASALKKSPEQLHGKRFQAFLSNDSADEFDSCLGQLDTESDVVSQFTITTINAKAVWASRCVIYRNSNEQPYVLLSGHDVTEQVNREQQLILANQRDDLTGLFRRSELDVRIEEMVENYQKTGAPFAIAMIDIDHFKNFNDDYGHQAGDEVLKVISRTVQKCCRSADVVARYGGEELLVLFPLLSPKEAAVVSNRLRKTIANITFQMVNANGEECLTQTSVSIGIAGAPLHAEDADDLIKAADDAMYQAKCAGRDRVCIFSETAPRKPERRQQKLSSPENTATSITNDAPVIISRTEV